MCSRNHIIQVERFVSEGELVRVGLQQRCLDPGPLEVPAGEVELLRLDVDADEADARKFLPEHCQHGTCAAADLEEARSRLELRAVSDQTMPPVLRLLHEPLLLGGRVAVNVVRHPRAEDTGADA
jgi:hypothetical protein